MADGVTKMETSNVLQFIDQYVTQLMRMGAIGVEQYEQKLKNNAKNIARLDDLFFEGRAALLFLKNRFKVTLRESPDLKIELDNEVVYIEAKHFGKKEQDRIEEKAMSETKDLLVPIGDTTATEGSTVWEQIANVAIHKAGKDQYMMNAPNILIIESSSDSTSLTLSSAAHEYNDRVRKTNDPRLRRLNALMLVNCCLYGFGNSGTYNTEFCLLDYIDTPMSKRLTSTLFYIQLG